MIKVTISDNPDRLVTAETPNGIVHLSLDKLIEYFPSLREYPYEHLNVKTVQQEVRAELRQKKMMTLNISLQQ